MAKKKDFSNSPFSALKKLKKKQEKREDPIPRPQQKEKRFSRSELSDEELFLREVGDVDELQRDSFFEADPPEHIVFLSEEEEGSLLLQELMDGRGEFTTFLGEEYIEGYVHDLDPKIFQKLKRGKYSIQSDLDLHGMFVKDAKEALRNFVYEQQSLGNRCVLIVHGRGLHSAGQVPILKSELVTWMTRGFLRKKVLAFCSAKKNDGGVGAVYVLLRRIKML